MNAFLVPVNVFFSLQTNRKWAIVSRSSPSLNTKNIKESYGAMTHNDVKFLEGTFDVSVEAPENLGDFFVHIWRLGWCWKELDTKAQFCLI